jgi:hypothetical protein
MKGKREQHESLHQGSTEGGRERGFRREEERRARGRER